MLPLPRPARRPTLILAVLTALAGLLPACTSGPGFTEVTIRHSRFGPDELTFHKGETAVFVLTNTDPIDHEFILGDEGVQRRHELGTEPYHDSIPTEVSIPAGRTVRTSITFGEVGEFIIGCHLPGHFAYGMKASVKVV